MTLPEPFLTRMERLLGAEYPAFLASYDEPAARGLRLNLLRVPADAALPFPTEPVAWCPSGRRYSGDLRPGLHPWHDAGVYYIQEPSAMVVAEAAAPRPGDWVLDLCAAPGGKSSHLASLMGGQGLLVANEIHPQRAKILSRNIERMGIANALVTCESPARLAARFPAAFDRIIVDAPCSGVTKDTLLDSTLCLILTANIEETPVGEKMYIKDTKYLKDDPLYNELVNRFYSTIVDINEDIIKKFLITFVNAKYTFVLYEEQDILGQEITLNKRELISELENFLIMANTSISLENLNTNLS